MDEIDYREYYMRYSDENRVKSERKESTKSRKFRGKTAWILTFVVLFLAFSLTVTFASVLGENGALSVFSEEEKGYYYSVAFKSGEDYDKAREYATFVRQSGKGGNIVKIDGEYYAIYATYLTESDAKTVADRGEKLVVLKKKFVDFTLGKDLETYAAHLNELRKKTVSVIYDLCIALNKEGEVRAQDPLNALISEYEFLKTSVDDEPKFNTSQKLSIYVAIDTNIGRLKAILNETEEVEAESEMWFQMYSIIS